MCGGSLFCIPFFKSTRLRTKTNTYIGTLYTKPLSFLFILWAKKRSSSSLKTKSRFVLFRIFFAFLSFTVAFVHVYRLRDYKLFSIV